MFLFVQRNRSLYAIYALNSSASVMYVKSSVHITNFNRLLPSLNVHFMGFPRLSQTLAVAL